jgi:hypothetical protein
MINQVLNPMHAQPNCKVSVFKLYGFMCSLTNVVYVFDQRFGYLPYMPLYQALKHGEIEQL